jgi:GT2 family glycosyltransferase
VSIVIPFFRRQEELEQLLASLDHIDATGLTVETLVVEDGSPVASKTQLQQQYPKLNLRFLANPGNLGPGHSRNHGVRESHGVYLWFLDTDTLAVNPDVLHSLIRALTEEPSRLAVGGTIETADGTPFIMHPVILPSLHFVYEKAPVEESYKKAVPFLATANLFMNRDRFLTCSGFDGSLKMYEDNELCMRLQQLIGGCFYQDANTLMLHGVSLNGRDAGVFDYCVDRRRYIRIKLITRNILLRRYQRWRLAVMPALEVVSILMFLIGSARARWHMSRVAIASAKLSLWAKLRDMATLMMYSAYAMVVFLYPAGGWPASRNPPLQPAEVRPMN